MSPDRQPVAVVVGATSKWQADGRNTRLAHGKDLDDRHLPVGVRWGVGGAIAQKFAKEGFLTVLTTRKAANAAALERAITSQGGRATTVELDLVSDASIAKAFATIRERAGDPDVLVYNAGYLEGAICRPRRNCSSTYRSTSSRPRSTSPAAGRSWSPRRCCPRCARAEAAPSSSPTTPRRFAAGSG
jgi:NAD(P)-dependent dehydrogenase (short-subunit alcohol dehydrogenase family)